MFLRHKSHFICNLVALNYKYIKNHLILKITLCCNVCFSVFYDYYFIYETNKQTKYY